MTDGINHLKKSRVPLSPEMAELHPAYRSIGASISYHVDRDNIPKTIDGGISIYLIPENENMERKTIGIIEYRGKNHKEFVIAAKKLINILNRAQF